MRKMNCVKIIITIFCFMSVHFNMGFSETISDELKKNIGKTPPMGWNSWNYFRGGISAEVIMAIADGAKKYKLNEAGYKYLVIDDVWQEKELGPKGELVASAKKFPAGIAPLVKYVKERGFELGIYSSPNKVTCANYPGTLGFEDIHAQQFADWGCKFVKYDHCPSRNMERELSKEEIVKRYWVFGNALKAADPEIVYAICEKGWAGLVNGRQNSVLNKMKEKGIEIDRKQMRLDAFSWYRDIGGVMWRTTGDIGPNWKKIMKILDEQEGLYVLCGPNSFNDPDMLEVGNGDLTESENRAHFSLWCILSAPLILGNDLRNIPEHVLKIITHKEVIALNQDLLCKQAEKVIDKDDMELFVKPLANGDIGVCALNRGDSNKKFTVNWKDIGLKSGTVCNVRDLWAQKDLGEFDNQVTSDVKTHDVVVYRISKK